VNSREARKMKLAEGDRVRLTSELGEAVVHVTLDSGVMPGTVFFPVHHEGPQVRDLVSMVLGGEREGSVPQFRFARVTMAKVEAAAEVAAGA